MKNYGDLGGCYPPRPTASTDNTPSISIILQKILSLIHSLLNIRHSYNVLLKRSSQIIHTYKKNSLNRVFLLEFGLD